MGKLQVIKMGCYSRLPGIGLIMSLALLHSCEIINPEESTPSFLEINNPNVETDLQSEGSASAKLTEIWLTVNGQFLGAYDTPSTIPVFEEGTTSIRLEAGIRDNGISRTPEIYPFYAPFDVEVNLSLNEVQQIDPVFSYRKGIDFAFIDNFETEGHLFQDIREGGPDFRVKITEEGQFEGNSSALIELNEDIPLVEVATTNRYEGLLDDGLSVYLEVNYKAQVPVVFGVIGHQKGVQGLGQVAFDPGFNANESWNKIYFNLTPLIIQGGFDEYQIVFRAALTNDQSGTELKSAKVWLDNIKLIHF